MTFNVQSMYSKCMASTKNNQIPIKGKPGPSQMPPKWLQVIDLMVIGGLDFQPAMEAAGYSESYYTSHGHRIKADVRFCKLYDCKRKERTTKSEDDRMDTLLMLRFIRDNKDEATRDRTAAAKEIAAICGWHSETIRTETTERQQLLDAAQRQEMSRLALLALDTRSLPDINTTRKAVHSTILTQTVPTEPIQDMSPAPIQDMSPAPVQDMSPAPVQDMSPAPVQDKTIRRWPFTDRGSDNE